MTRRLSGVRRRLLSLLATLVLSSGALAACGSSSHASTHAPSSQCQKVAAVLSDGPDPDADPVGYAEAQIQPLHTLVLSDRALQNATNSLSRAYGDYYLTNGSNSSVRALDTASAAVNALCPGVAQ